MAAISSAETRITDRADVTRPDDALEVAEGTLAGEFIVDRKIAAGGCAAVYLAHHHASGERRAIKFLHRAVERVPGMIERFEREARAASIIRHPNIVQVFDFAALPDGRPYFSMEYLEGSSLSELVRVKGRFTPAEAYAVLAPVCSALEAAHAAGIVHRDVKGENIFVTHVGGEQVVKLLDFGIAKLMQPDPSQPHLTTAGMAIGTPSTMSPEQIRGDHVDARTDIYALGVVLYQLLTGSVPFKGTTREEVVRSHLGQKAPLPSQRVPASPALDALVQRSLEKDPAQRFSSAMAFSEALRQAVHGSPTQVTGHEVLGLYVGTSYAQATEDQLDQALDDAMRVLERAAAELVSAGYTVCLQTGSSQLGVQKLSDDASERRESQRRALQLAVDLGRSIENELKESPVVVTLCVHVAAAELESSTAGLELRGGPIAQVDEWVPKEGAQRISMTAGFATSLGDEAITGPFAGPAGE